MSCTIPETALPFVCDLKAAETERADAWAALDAIDAAKPLLLRLEAALNHEAATRERLYALLLASGLKRKAAKRLAFGEY